MSDSDWRINPVAGCLIGVALLLFGAPLLHDLNRCSGADRGSGQQTGERNQIANHCAGPRAPPVVPKTPDPNPNPDRNEWRQEQDLSAQNASAFWAPWMFFATLAGVVYVARTLNETRKATEAAMRAAEATERSIDVTRDIGQKQVRAYLSLGAARLMHTDLGLGKEAVPHLGFRFRIRNAGQSPAKDLKLYVECTIDIPGFRNIVRWVSIGVSPIAAGTREWAEVYINYNNGLEEPLRGLPDMLDITMATLGIVARIDGFDVFEEPLDPATCAYSFKVFSFDAGQWYPLERITSELLADRDERALRD